MPIARPSTETDVSQHSSATVRLLDSPRTYNERTEEVVQLETHISWVFLTSRFAYKLKKPVRYDFLDFSTPEKRRWACQREVELNRRLAQDVYLGIVPITQETKGRLKLGGTGEPVDWVVKMRRLPADRALDRLIRNRSVSTSDATDLARRLARFYQQLPPLNINAEVYRRRIEDHIRGNEIELAKPQYDFNPKVLKRISTALIRLLRLAPETLDARVCDGRIVDGHGDLRPEHIYFDPQPTIIDCVEFNDEFRQIDVLDELAFLAAECEHLGATEIGNRIIEEYQTTSCDSFPKSLLEFYKCYRACVRAKVLLLRGVQVGKPAREQFWEDARTYLRLAELHASRLGPPVLVVVYGLSGTGKTTLAHGIAERLGTDLLSTDSVRRDLFAPDGHHRNEEDLYDPERRQQVYEEMFRRAKNLLGKKLSVVLDGTFQSAGLRERAVALAGQAGAKPCFLYCQCAVDSAVERIKARRQSCGTLSDATPVVYQRQLEAFEQDPPDLPVHVIDTDQSPAEISQSACDCLRAVMLPE